MQQQQSDRSPLIKRLEQKVKHGTLLCSVEITEEEGLITKIQLWCNFGGVDSHYAAPLAQASYPEMLVLKDYAENEGIAAALAAAGIVEITTSYGNTKICKMLVK